MKKIVYIDGMCCERCAKRVEDRLLTVKNAVSVDVKLKKNLAIIRSREEVDDGEIKAVIEEAGFRLKPLEPSDKQT